MNEVSQQKTSGGKKKMIAPLLPLKSDGRARDHLMFPVLWPVACLLGRFLPKPCACSSNLVESLKTWRCDACSIDVRSLDQQQC
jgi:hypothetical protein